MRSIVAIFAAAAMLFNSTTLQAAPSGGRNVESAIALSYVAYRCSISLNRDTEAWTQGLIQAANSEVNASAVQKGERTYQEQVATLGKRKACQKARGVLREAGWL